MLRRIVRWFGSLAILSALGLLVACGGASSTSGSTGRSSTGGLGPGESPTLPNPSTPPPSNGPYAVIRYMNASKPAGNGGSAAASCGTNETLLSGGFDVHPNSPSPAVFAAASYPTENRTWKVEASGPIDNITAYALCLRTTNRLTIQIVQNTQTATGAQTLAQASCPAGTVATGGGFRGGTALPGVITSKPVQGGWSVLAASSSGLAVTAYAVCVGPTLKLAALPAVAFTYQKINGNPMGQPGKAGPPGTVECAAKQTLVGGGFSTETGQVNAYQTNAPLNASAQWFLALNSPPSDGSSTIYAVCVTFL